MLKNNRTNVFFTITLAITIVLSAFTAAYAGPVGINIPKDKVIEKTAEINNNQILGIDIKVQDIDGEWVEETHVLVGDTIRFRITVANQINYDMIDVHVESILTPSDILTYSESLAWNFDIILASGEIIIEFETTAVKETDVNGVICSTYVTADLDPKYVKDVERKKADLTIKEAELQASILKLEDIQNNIDSLLAEKILLEEKYNQDVQLIESLKLDITSKEQIVADLKAYEESLNIKIVDQKVELDAKILKNRDTANLLDQNQLDIDGLNADQLVLQDVKLQKIEEQEVLEGQLKTALDEISAGNEDVKLLNKKIEEKDLEILAVDGQIQNNDLLLQGKLDEKTVLEAKDSDETLAIESLKADIKADEVKLSDLQLQEGNLETTVALQKEDLNNLILLNEETNKQIEQAQVNIDSLLSEESILRAKNLNEIQTIDVLKNDILAAETILADVQMKIDQTNLDLTDQQEKLVAEEATKQDIELKIIDLQDNINANELLLADTQQRVENVDIKLAAQKSDLNNLILSNDQTKLDITATEEALNQLKADQLTLQTKDADETLTIDGLKTSIAADKIKLADLQLQEGNLITTIDQQNKDLNNLILQNEGTKQQLDLNQENIDAELLDKAALETKDTDETLAIEGLKTGIAADEIKLLDIKNQKTLVENDLAAEKAELESWVSINDQTKQDIASIEETLNLLESDQLVLQTKDADETAIIEALEADKDATELSLSDTDTKIAEVDAELISQKARLAELEAGYEQTVSTINANQEVIDSHISEKSSLEQTKQDAEDELFTLKSNYVASILNRDVDGIYTYSHAIASKTEEISLIDGQIADTQSSINLLESENEVLLNTEADQKSEIDALKESIAANELLLIDLAAEKAGYENDLLSIDDDLEHYISQNAVTKQSLQENQDSIDSTGADLLVLQTKDADETLTIDGLKTSIAADKIKLADLQLQEGNLESTIATHNGDLNNFKLQNDQTKQDLLDVDGNLDLLSREKLALEIKDADELQGIDGLEKDLADNELKLIDAKNLKIIVENDLTAEKADLESWVLINDQTKLDVQLNQDNIDGTEADLLVLQTKDADEKLAIDWLKNDIAGNELILVDLADQESLIGNDLAAQKIELDSYILQDEESQQKIDDIKSTILVDEGILNDLIQQDDILKTYINLKKADLSGVESDNEQTKQLLGLKQLEIDDSKVDLFALQAKDADETLTIDGLKTSIAADEAILADIKLEVDTINNGISLKSLDLNDKIAENNLTQKTLAQTLLDIDGLNADKLALHDLKLEKIGEKEALVTQLKTVLDGIGEDNENVKILAAKIEEKDLEILSTDKQIQNNDLLLQDKLNEKTMLVEQDSLEKQLINGLLISIDSDEKLLVDAKEKEDSLKVELVSQNEELDSKLLDADQTLIIIKDKQADINDFINYKNIERQINLDLEIIIDDIKKKIKADEEYIAKINDELLNLHDGMARVFVNPAHVEPLPPISDPGGPYEGYTGDVILLDGSNSYDLDGEIVGYKWDYTIKDSFPISIGEGETIEYTWNEPGTYDLRLAVIDNDKLKNSSTTTVMIKPSQGPENTDPVANDDYEETVENIPSDFNVLLNDQDLDGDILSINSIDISPANGIASIVSDEIHYIPNDGFNGSDSLIYNVTDGNGGYDTATVYITVHPPGTPPVNHPPVAVNDPRIYVYEDSTNKAIYVLRNDFDPDVGDTIVINSIVSFPSNGTVEIFGDIIYYTSDAGFNGTNSFTYSIRDNDGEVDTAEVTVKVFKKYKKTISKPDKEGGYIYFQDNETYTAKTLLGLFGLDAVILGPITINVDVDENIGFDVLWTELCIDSEEKVNSTETSFSWTWSERIFGFYTIETVIHGEDIEIYDEIDVLILSLGYL